MPADDAVTDVPGVGASRAEELAELGVETVGDLANFDNDEWDSYIENAQAYLAKEDAEEEAEVTDDAGEEEATEPEPEDTPEDTSEDTSEEEAPEEPEDAEEEASEEPPEQEAEEEEEEVDLEEEVQARIHAGHPTTFEFLDDYLDHEVKDYKRYTVTVTRETLEDLLENPGQPHVTPLA